MFLDWKNWIVKLTIPPKAICRFSVPVCQITCQITKDVFHRIRTKNFTICIETQKTSNSQCSPFFKKDLFCILAVVGPCCCPRTSLVASSGNCLRQCLGFSLWWPCLLWSAGSRHTGSVVVADGLSCTAACGIFLDQGPNWWYSFHCKVDS